MFDLFSSDVFNTILLRRFPFADFLLQIPYCRTSVQFPKLPLHLLLHKLSLNLSLRVRQRICPAQIPLHCCGLANLQSTWVQSSLQDYSLAALQSILVPIIIA